jgi:hypothetical protein
MTSIRSQEDQRFNELQLAEYHTLRAESDRISQFLANAVWVGVTGFALSIVAAGTLAESGLSLARVIQATLILLLFQSMAITIMYLSELYKYKRVGVYIRSHIEARYRSYGINRRPLFWESWIEKRRARFLHLSAIAFLQTPSLGTVVLLFIGSSGHTFTGERSFFARIASQLFQDPSVVVLLCILLASNFMFVALSALNLGSKRWKQN